MFKISQAVTAAFQRGGQGNAVKGASGSVEDPDKV